jgi:hypothetical protein
MRWLFAALRRVLVGAVLASVFVISVLIAAMLHLDLPVVRRVVEQQVNGALRTLPGDHAKITGLRRLDIRGLQVDRIDVEIEGAGRGHAENVRVRADLLTNLWGALGRRHQVALRLRSVSIAQVTFQLPPSTRAPPPKTVEKAPSTATALHLDVGRFDVVHAYAYGPLEKGPYVDVDVDRASGSFALHPGHLSGALAAVITARGVLALPLSIDFDGSATLPLASETTTDDEIVERTGRVSLVARAGAARLDAEATLAGDRVSAEVSVPKVGPEVARAAFSRWPLTASLSLHARGEGTLDESTFQIDSLVGAGHVAVTGRARLRGTPRAHMNVAARDIDPSDFVDVLPALRMDLDADLDVDPDTLRVAARTQERGAALVAHATLTHGRLDAHAALDSESAAFKGFRVESAHAAADIAGSLDDLRGRLWARLAGVSRGPLRVDDLQVIAEGTSQSLNVEVAGGGGTWDVLALQARVQPRAPLRVADLSARVERGGQSVGLKAPEIVVDAPRFDVPFFQIQGLGQPIDAQIHYAPGRLRAQLAGPDVDLAPLSGILTSTSGRIAGRGAVDVDIDTSPRAPRATARLRLVNARYASWPEVAVVLDLDVDGARAHGRLQLDNPDLGAAALEAELDAGKPITGWKSLEDAKGNVIVNTDRVPIERICLVVRCPEMLAASTASVVGKVGARLEVSRTGPRDHAKGEDTKATLEVEAQDADGRLAYLSAKARLDLASAIALRRVPVDAPIDARFGVEARSFDRLPPVLQPLPLSGLLSMHGYAEGTIAQPFLVVEVDGSDLKMRGATRDTPPLELGWVTTYDLEDAASDIDLRMGAAHVVRATLQVNATVPQLLGTPGEKPWSGGLYVEVDRFLLKLLPALAEKETSGALSGRLSVSGIHESPVVASHLSIDDLRFGDEVVGPVAVSLEATDRTCVASLEAGASNQPARATLRARAGCRWKNGTVPSLVSDVPAEIALDAAQFPIVAVQPLLSKVFGRLHGNLDAHLTASGHPDQGVGRWAVRGEAHLRDASVLPLVLGREIIRLDMQATADGSGVVRVPHFSGEMGAGAFTGQGTVVLRDNSVDHAHAELHVAKRKAIPVTMEGVSYGTVWGDVIGDARVADGQLLVTLRAPTLRLELPPQRTGNLERLDHNPAVVVLQPLSAAPPVTAMGGGPGPPGPRVPRVVASVELGENVGVSRDDLKIELTTPAAPQNPKISLDGDVTIDGSIRLLGGRVPVAGRVFRVERGVVQFGGSDPADPALDVDAVYEGPDTSITIKVHVGGTAKDAKITLQSTPAKSQSEILAILTFGEAAPATTGPSGISGPQQGTSTIAGAAGSAAAGVGSAIVTTGLNQVLSQSVIPIRTSVSAGTSSTASAAASIDVSERLRFEYIRSFGTPSQVGQQIDDNQFAVDWRFKSRWMLRTIVGTRGTAALDLLWQRWY